MATERNPSSMMGYLAGIVRDSRDTASQRLSIRNVPTVPNPAAITGTPVSGPGGAARSGTDSEATVASDPAAPAPAAHLARKTDSAARTSADGTVTTAAEPPVRLEQAEMSAQVNGIPPLRSGSPQLSLSRATVDMPMSGEGERSGEVSGEPSADERPAPEPVFHQPASGPGFQAIQQPAATAEPMKTAPRETVGLYPRVTESAYTEAEGRPDSLSAFADAGRSEFPTTGPEVRPPTETKKGSGPAAHNEAPPKNPQQERAPQSPGRGSGSYGQGPAQRRPRGGGGADASTQPRVHIGELTVVVAPDDRQKGRAHERQPVRFQGSPASSRLYLRRQ